MTARRRKKPCKHSSVGCVDAEGYAVNPHDPAQFDRLHWIECCDCGELVPIGPATITPEVEQEIRAAEIAAALEVISPPQWDHWRGNEWYGWLAHRQNSVDAYGLDAHWPGFAAGWLAHAIGEHDEAGE